MRFHQQSALKVGLVINPYAGIGGALALKGSDNRDEIDAALESGAPYRAYSRIDVFLKALDVPQEHINWYCWGGSMGSDALRSCGFNFVELGCPKQSATYAEDTAEAIAAFVQKQLDIIVFAGGDGTARIVFDTIPADLPVLGVPAGVKIQSGCFSISPNAAAEVLSRIAMGQWVDVVEQEVRDLDEAAYRDGIIKSQYYGEVWVPQIGHFIQATKQGGVEIEELVLDDIAADVLESEWIEGAVIWGPGTTVKAVTDAIGFTGSLLGFDLTIGQTLITEDVTEAQLHAWLESLSEPVRLVVAPTGGQGFLIGRGNHQLSPRNLMAIGRQQVVVLASKSKLKALDDRPILIDSGHVALDRDWTGLIRITTGYRDSVLYRLSDGY